MTFIEQGIRQRNQKPWLFELLMKDQEPPYEASEQGGCWIGSASAPLNHE